MTSTTKNIDKSILEKLNNIKSSKTTQKTYTKEIDDLILAGYELDKDRDSLARLISEVAGFNICVSSMRRRYNKLKLHNQGINVGEL